MQLVGLDTYCRLHRHDPSLYVAFTDCENVPPHHSDIEAVIVTSGLDSQSIKRDLVIAAAGGSRSAVAEELVNSSQAVPLNHLQDNNVSQALWFIWVTVVVVAFIFALYTLGVVDDVFTAPDSLLSRVVAYPM